MQVKNMEIVDIRERLFNLKDEKIIHGFIGCRCTEWYRG